MATGLAPAATSPPSFVSGFHSFSRTNSQIAFSLSQERLAHSSDLNMTHVAKIERSEREPGVRTVSKLTRALGISAAELFDGIDGRTTSKDDEPLPHQAHGPS